MVTVPDTGPLKVAIALLLAAPVAFLSPVCAQTPAAYVGVNPATESPGYATLARLTLAAPVILDATVSGTARIKGAEAADVAPGYTRYYVTADVGALLRGAGGVPPQIGYLVDVAPDADGRAPKLKKLRVLVFARPVAGRPGQLQLITPHAQLVWDPALDATVRRIATEAVGTDAPPVVTGIGNAFHVPGTLPGEGETQIFLTTADNRPVSLSILRRPNQPPRWAVALSEIVDDAAAPPARDTLLWYRLACFLPSELPAASIASLGAADADVAREDYRFVLEQLGPCERRVDLTPAG